jgi:hypothetical protein
MLKEVSQALLVIILLHSTYIVVDVEASLTLWLLIVADVVSHAILELTNTYCWVERQLLHLRTDTRHTNKECYE